MSGINNETSKGIDYAWLLGFIVLFSLPIFFPESTWGFHFWVFLSPLAKITFALILLLISTYSIWAFYFFPPSITYTIFDFHRVKYLLPLLAGVLFFYFPIFKDLYGDSFLFEPYLTQTATEMPEHLSQAIFAYDFTPATSRQFLLALLTLASISFAAMYQTVFVWSGIIMGILFYGVWVYQINKYQVTSVKAWILLAMIVSAPFTLTFYGHMDNYGIVYLALLLWLMGLVNTLKSSHRNSIWFLLVGLLFILKIHPLFLLLIPAWVLAFIVKKAPKSKLYSLLISIKGVFTFMGFPIFIVGAYLYFFVFKDYNDPRILQDIRDFDRLFLPLISPDAPYDKYNVWSWAHILDFANILLYWSPVSLLVFFTVKPQKTQTEPIPLILGFTLLLFVTFIFMINPLITMPMDWDLFSIPAIIWMVIIFYYATLPTSLPISSARKAIIIAVCLISASFIIVNHSAPALSQRVETVGKHVYKTYYEHSPRIIHSGIAINTQSIDDYLERKNQLISDLAPYSQAPNDIKFAMFHTDNGILYQRDKHDLSKALFHFTEAEKYAPNYWLNTEQLMHLHSELKNEKEALSYAQKLLKNNYPSPEKSKVNMVFQEIKFSKINAAAMHCNAFLKEYPSSIELQNLQSQIHSNTQIQLQK
jgi:hypothetical protein